jgi:hypothetical protein
MPDRFLADIKPRSGKKAIHDPVIGWILRAEMFLSVCSQKITTGSGLPFMDTAIGFHTHWWFFALGSAAAALLAVAPSLTALFWAIAPWAQARVWIVIIILFIVGSDRRYPDLLSPIAEAPQQRKRDPGWQILSATQSASLMTKTESSTIPPSQISLPPDRFTDWMIDKQTAQLPTFN